MTIGHRYHPNQSSSSSILQRTAISTTSKLGPSISLIRQRIADSTFEFWGENGGFEVALITFDYFYDLTNYIHHIQSSYMILLVHPTLYQNWYTFTILLDLSKILLQTKVFSGIWDLTLFLGLTGYGRCGELLLRWATSCWALSSCWSTW